MTYASGRLEVTEPTLHCLRWEDQVIQLGATDGGEGELSCVPIVHVPDPDNVGTDHVHYLSPVPAAIVIEGRTAGLE